MTLHLRVNPITCTGHGMCAEVFPELIGLDDWGYPIIQDEGIVPRDLEAYAQRAADVCPTLAILLERKRDAAPRGRAEARRTRA